MHKSYSLMRETVNEQATEFIILHRENATAKRAVRSPSRPKAKSQITGIFFWGDFRVPEIIFKQKPERFFCHSLRQIRTAALPQREVNTAGQQQGDFRGNRTNG